jgi:hypothetical protein
MGDRGTTHAAAGANLAVLKVGGLRYRFATALAAADPTRATPTGGHRQVMEFLTGKHSLRIAPEILSLTYYSMEKGVSRGIPPATIEIAHIFGAVVRKNVNAVSQADRAVLERAADSLHCAGG